MADTITQVLEQDPVPPRTLNKRLPRDLETITLKCLVKEAAKRYASARELADDLRRFLDGEPIKARQVPAPQRLFYWCRKHPGSALARGSLVLIALLTLQWIGEIVVIFMMIPLAILATPILFFYYWLVCGFVRWKSDGSMMDTIVGSLWGTWVGGFSFLR